MGWPFSIDDKQAEAAFRKAERRTTSDAAPAVLGAIAVLMLLLAIVDSTLALLDGDGTFQVPIALLGLAATLWVARYATIVVRGAKVALSRAHPPAREAKAEKQAWSRS